MIITVDYLQVHAINMSDPNPAIVLDWKTSFKIYMYHYLWALLIGFNLVTSQVIFSVIRTFLYAILAQAAFLLFPPQLFGLIYGVLNLLNGITTLLADPIFRPGWKISLSDLTRHPKFNFESDGFSHSALGLYKTTSTEILPRFRNLILEILL